MDSLPPKKAHKEGEVSRRELAAYVVLAAFLIASALLVNNGHVILAWLTGAAGFVVAAMIAGKESGGE